MPPRSSVRRAPLGALVLSLALVLPALAHAQQQAPGTVRPASASTAARAHDVDRAHSEINFVASSRLLDAHGHFKTWDADLQIDPDALERSTVKLTIDAASIDTRIERRDNHLKSADFLDVAKYPTITFVSSSIAKSAPTTGTITGELTMHGVTKTVQVPVSMVFYQNGRGRFRGQFTLKRSDYGVTYNSGMNPIEDEIQVQFNLSVAEKKG